MIPENLQQTNDSRTPITIAFGNGIGPEIMQVALNILSAAEANIGVDAIEIGEDVFKSGIDSGITPEAWNSVKKTKILFKAPITTPQGKGFKSLNVTFRKALGLFANIRPSLSYHPYVPTKHPKLDLVIVRENEEDTYTGIEYQQTQGSTQCLKIITRHGCEKIVRYAFEYAKQTGRKKVTCMSKDNIMKMTDGLFHQVFKEIASEYPNIQNEHYIIDIGTAMVADQPERFDVIVTLNLYGDILSDVASQIAGSVGLAGSSNIGNTYAMFEAIHGSAPDIAGQDIANPSAIIQASTMMLNHLGMFETANKIQNALLRTIEDGIHTKDIYQKDISKEAVGTKEFGQAVIHRLGKAPQKLAPSNYQLSESIKLHPFKVETIPAIKELVGIDIFLEWGDVSTSPIVLADMLNTITQDPLKLHIITNRGFKVYPDGFPNMEYGDLWRCRYFPTSKNSPLEFTTAIDLLSTLESAGFEIVKTENLYNFNGQRGYSLGQGE